MSHPYLSESIWYDKYKADEAELHWHLHLARQSRDSGKKEALHRPTEKRNEEQKVKTVNRVVQPPLVPAAKVVPTSSLVDEIARTREHIKLSLQSSNICTPVGEADHNLVLRVTQLEKETERLNSNVAALTAVMKTLQDCIESLKRSTGTAESNKVVNHVSSVSKPSSAQKEAKNEDDDDDIDLFGSDEDEEANELREKRLQAYAEKKSKKAQVIAKSIVILDVKPWDDETDMAAMQVAVRKIQMDGLLWGASKYVPLAYGIQKLQICCVVEDEKVSIEELQEKIEAIEDLVQSVDIAAFNKI